LGEQYSAYNPFDDCTGTFEIEGRIVLSMTSTYPLSQRAKAIKSSDVRDLLRYAQAPNMISLAGGLPASELFDVAGIRKATEHTLRDSPSAALQYGITEGQTRLRVALLQHLKAKGIAANLENLIVTSGSQQALDLIARALIDAGDTVVVERPTYLAALQAFGLCAPNYKTISIDAQGGCVEELSDLEKLDAHLKPKLVYVVTNFANPSGASMSLERRTWLAHWAMNNKVMVLEDDPYGDLHSGNCIPPLMAVAAGIPGASQWCGYTSTLSKCVAPGLRIGWLVLPASLAKTITLIKQAMDLHTSSFTQEIASRYLESGAMEVSLTTIRKEYSMRSMSLQSALTRTFGSAMEFTPSTGGMFLWARFTDGSSSRDLLAHAIKENVMFVPGDAFYTDSPDQSTLRLNFTGATPAQINEGVARLRRAYEKTKRLRVES
jgi:2-aminoadipate transaminase